MRVLVTGGAGFIGSHLVDALVARGHEVRVYDNLDGQVHGDDPRVPEYLNRESEFIQGDIRDREALRKALNDVEVVYHEASAVGVGQSMYQIEKYTHVNVLGTANLLDIIVNEKTRVEKLILASSMSNYGEGKYHCQRCGVVFPKLRGLEQLKLRRWEVQCPSCQASVTPLPTDESKPLFPTSVYATNKRDQEEMFCEIGLAYDIPTVVLRYFNVYGPRQALANPYTGVIAIFSNCLLGETAPVIFEDGLQTRDFTSVHDIVQANLLALDKHRSGVEIYNVGTGLPTNLLQLIELLQGALSIGNGEKPWQAANRFRAGDIRHCFADISKITSQLGYRPQIPIATGIKELIEWLQSQTPKDVLSKAMSELEAKGLVK
jgi:dTDP-L-rhamnose 4-epimerase